MANGKGHKILTKAALETLPGWEREILAPVKEALENDYCMYGDSYFGNQKEIGPYIELPDGRLPMDPWEIRYFRKDAPGVDWHICGYYDLMRYSFEYFAEKCIESLKENRIEDYAKFAGSIAHVIEDCGCPPHAVGTNMGTDMKMIKMLYPSPDKKKMARQFHCVLEGKYEPFSIDYKPQFMGSSPEEISFNLFERFTDMLENSIAQIIPMVDAFYKDDEKTLSAHLTASGKDSSKVLADFIHSTLCAAHSKPEDATPVYLSECTPKRRTAWAPFPYPYAEIRNSPCCLDREFNPVKLSLLFDGQERFFEKGFGLGAPFEMNYILPSEVFRTFNAYVGLHSKLGGESGIVFKVIGDGTELVRVECKDINDSRTLEVNISGVKEFTLKVESGVPEKAWPNNTHAVWGKPVLHRR